MTTTREELVEQLRVTDTDTVCDLFADALAGVQARYGAAITAACSEAEIGLWTARAVALRRYRRAVGPDDRNAMIGGILLLRAERQQLQASAATSAAAGTGPPQPCARRA